MGKTIGFTYDLKEEHEVKGGLPEDAFAEFDAKETIDSVCQAIEAGGHKVIRIGNARNLIQQLPDLGVDIVFNICEGVGGRNRESEVPVILDLYKIPFVGCDGLSLGMTLDKVMAKKVFIADGVPTPKYFIADKIIGLSNMDSMKFPFMVKPRYEGSSKGVSDNSKVSNKEDLVAQVNRIHDLYRQPALVEEFICGTEFTVLIIGNDEPTVYPPVQIKICDKLELGDLIYTSRRLVTPDVEYVCPPKVSESLDKKLREVALRAYQAVDCRDFCRVDIRVDEKGHPYVLEVNPLPSLSTEDVFPVIAKAAGTTYEQLILKVIEAALKRYGMK